MVANALDPNKVDYQENFESFLSGTAPTDSWYTVTTTGTGTQQVFASTAIGGSKLWRLDDDAANYAVQLRNTASNVNLCGTNQVFAFRFNLQDPIGTGMTFDLRVSGAAVSGAAQPANTLGITLSGNAGSESIIAYIRGSTGAAVTSTLTTAYTAGTTIDVAISQVNCSGSASALVSISGAITASAIVTASSAITGDLDRWEVAQTDAIASGTFLRLDDYAWQSVQRPAPVVTSINPTSGPTGGGTAVTISGTDFYANGATNPTITFGGASATDVVVVSSTTLTAKTPLHTAGAVDVVVTNPDAQTDTLPAGFLYMGGGGSNCTGTSFAEDYESFAVGVFPDQCWYDQVVTNPTCTAGTPCEEIGKTVLGPAGTERRILGYSRNDGNALISIGYRLTPILTDVCDITGISLSIDVTMEDIPTSGNPFLVYLSTTSLVGSTSFNYASGQGTDFIGLEIDAAGIDGVSHGPASTSQVATGITPTAGGTYRLTITPTCTATTLGGSVSVTDTGTGTTATATLVTKTRSTTQPKLITGLSLGGPFDTTGACTDATSCHARWHDNFQIAGLPFSEASSISVPNLVGWDVDDKGDCCVIVRAGTPQGGTVYTYTAKGTMTLKSSTPTAGCDLDTGYRVGSLQDGVHALGGRPGRSGDYVAFLACDNSDGDVNEIRIRDSNFADPNQEGCSDYCVQNLEQGDSFSNPNQADIDDIPTRMKQISYVEEFPYSYEHEDTKGFNQVTVAFPYTEYETGRVGLYAYGFVNTLEDVDDADTYGYTGSGQTADQICSWQNRKDIIGSKEVPDGEDPGSEPDIRPRGRDLIAAVDASAPSMVFRFDVADDAFFGSSDSEDLVTDFGPYLTAGSGMEAAVGVACPTDGDTIGVVTAGGSVAVMNVTVGNPDFTGSPFATVEGVSTAVRGISLSVTKTSQETKENLYAAYVDGSEIVLTKGWDLQETCRIPLPAQGTFFGIELQVDAQNVWVAMSGAQGGVYRFDVKDCTTVVEVVTTDDDRTCTWDTDEDGIVNCEDPNPANADCDEDGIDDGVDPSVECNGFTCENGDCGETADPNAPLEGAMGAAARGFGAILGGGETTGRIILCLVFILVFTLIGFRLCGDEGCNNIMAGAIGAIFGFIFCLVSGLLPDVVVFTILLLVLLLGGFLFFRGRGEN